MPRPLRFELGDEEFALEMHKVDRAKLYGTKEVEVVDEHEASCELATLADDGRTLIGKGGTGLGWVDADGKWCDKANLKPINVDGDEVVPVKSSFSATIKLFDTATVDEYFEHNIRLLYELQPLDADSQITEAYKQLVDALKKGTIFTFPYSFRGGLEADAAFLLANDQGAIMMAVGSKTDVAYVGLQSSAAAAEETQTEAPEADDFDFDMI
jgi:hypothetical protein